MEGERVKNKWFQPHHRRTDNDNDEKRQRPPEPRTQLGAYFGTKRTIFFNFNQRRSRWILGPTRKSYFRVTDNSDNDNDGFDGIGMSLSLFRSDGHGFE